jgi:hypothetical protein
MYNTPCIETFRDRPAGTQPARIKQNIEISWNSIRRLNELCDSIGDWRSQTAGRFLRQGIIAEMATAEASYRHLIEALDDARDGPCCLAPWQAEARELDRTLSHLRERLRSKGILWPQI